MINWLKKRAEAIALKRKSELELQARKQEEAHNKLWEDVRLARPNLKSQFSDAGFTYIGWQGIAPHETDSAIVMFFVAPDKKTVEVTANRHACIIEIKYL